MSTYPGYGTFTPAHAQSVISQSNAVVKPLSTAELNKQRMSLAAAGNKTSQRELAQVRNDSRFNAGLENFQMPSSYAPTAAQQARPAATQSAGSAKSVRQILPAQPTPDQPSLNVQQPSGSVNYDTSISVGQATDPNRIRSLVNTAQQVDAGSATGDRAVDDYTRSMNMNNQAQMDMAVQGANSQQLMNAQQKRSESSISGLNDQAAIYNDAADRFRQALGLNTSVEAAQMSYNYGQQANNIRRLQNIGRNNP